jgi:hypothetical protein
MIIVQINHNNRIENARPLAGLGPRLRSAPHAERWAT